MPQQREPSFPENCRMLSVASLVPVIGIYTIFSRSDCLGAGVAGPEGWPEAARCSSCARCLYSTRLARCSAELLVLSL